MLLDRESVREREKKRGMRRRERKSDFFELIAMEDNLNRRIVQLSRRKKKKVCIIERNSRKNFRTSSFPSFYKTALSFFPSRWKNQPGEKNEKV